jgi:1-acyl-sn-glycerol-3-phosphate acyltransferase
VSGAATPAASLGGSTRAQVRWYAFARLAVATFSRIFWRVTVTGRENVPTTGAFVLAPVHRSNVDTVLCGCVTKRRLRYMAKDSLWKHRAAGWFFSSLGGFPVHRGAADREALRICEAAIAAGEPVVLFPEGTRRSGPRVTDLYEGAAFVASRAGVPIVPVGIGGSEGAMPKGKKGLRPVKIAIVIGPPLVPPPREAGGRGSRRQVRQLTERLAVELQSQFDQALARAGSGRVGDLPT